MPCYVSLHARAGRLGKAKYDKDLGFPRSMSHGRKVPSILFLIQFKKAFIDICKSLCKLRIDDAKNKCGADVKALWLGPFVCDNITS